MKMKIICSTVLSLMFASHAMAAEPLKMGVVVKVGGNAWFNSMEKGIKEAAAEEGINAWQVGPTAQDPAQQVKAIEDLIAQKVDIIGVVPVDPAALEPVLARAQQAGIKVITHESAGQKNANWDFEMVDAKTFGIEHMKLMASCMKEKGDYSIIVGSLTIPLHREWAQSAIDYQKQHYPNMKMVGDLFGTGESVDESMRVTNEQMAKYPDFGGMMAFGSPGPVGAGRAVANKKAKDKVCVVGAYSPGQAQRLVNTGDIKGGYIWNPHTAGQIFVRLGKMVAEGKTIDASTQVKGMGTMKVDTANHTLYGQSLESLDKDNLKKLVEMGL
ncbi:LacI family transcriptional regulator [Enterobacterales bacterium CwR94]|nr:LacI family transcriptional regulator [Enterobacterales bacterium CwR94]